MDRNPEIYQETKREERLEKDGQRTDKRREQDEGGRQHVRSRGRRHIQHSTNLQHTLALTLSFQFCLSENSHRFSRETPRLTVVMFLITQSLPLSLVSNRTTAPGLSGKVLKKDRTKHPLDALTRHDTNLLLLGEDPLSEADGLLVLVYLVVFLVHPLVEGVCV